MKAKIISLYLTAVMMLFLSSCSEITDLPSKELRLGSWIGNSSGSSFSLKFKGDDAVITLKDEKNRETKITGTTIVTDSTITVYDCDTLNEYKFDYKIYGDKVILDYSGKELELKNAH